MIYNVLFVSEQRVKDFTPLNANVDSSELRWGISQSQTIFIQESLGTRLFEKMGELVQTNDIEDPQYIRYKELLNNYIQPTLIWYSAVEYIPFSSVSFKSEGAVKHLSDQSVAPAKSEVDYLKYHAQSNADYYATRLQNYLISYSNQIPQYLESIGNQTQIFPDMSNTYFGGINL
jgi:hypothetical protein